MENFIFLCSEYNESMDRLFEGLFEEVDRRFNSVSSH